MTASAARRCRGLCQLHSGLPLPSLPPLSPLSLLYRAVPQDEDPTHVVVVFDRTPHLRRAASLLVRRGGRAVGGWVGGSRSSSSSDSRLRGCWGCARLLRSTGGPGPEPAKAGPCVGCARVGAGGGGQAGSSAQGGRISLAHKRCFGALHGTLLHRPSHALSLPPSLTATGPHQVLCRPGAAAAPGRRPPCGVGRRPAAAGCRGAGRPAAPAAAQGRPARALH